MCLGLMLRVVRELEQEKGILKLDKVNHAMNMFGIN